jgi:hypothetical protein
MKTIIDIQTANEVLALYQDATANIYVFNITLRRLVLMITSSNHKEVLYLTALSCKHIHGNFSWKNANISIKKTITNEENMIMIWDNDNDFQLLANGGFGLLQTTDHSFKFNWEF